MTRNASATAQSPTRQSTTMLALMLVVALLAGCSRSPIVTPTAQAQATATVSISGSPTPGPFVCANPAGSRASYAYIAADHQLTLVHGCSATEIHPRAGRILVPEAYSPSGQWLIASETAANYQATSNFPLCDTIINTATYATTITKYCAPSVSDPSMGWNGFIGWSDDSTYYEGRWGAGTDTSVTVVRVTLPDLQATKITTFPWVANYANERTPSGIVLRNGVLYYAGYASASDHSHAWLRRYSLATGQDTPIVSLGIAGYGGCQVQVDNTPCAWAGPWDMSADGGEIAYHIPGPTQSITDTAIEKNTPLYIVRSDGSNGTRLFPGVTLGDGFNAPSFSADGRYLEASFYSQASQSTSTFFERLGGASLIHAQDALYFSGWTPQSAVAIVLQLNMSNDYLQRPALYNVETQTLKPLQVGSSNYVWASGA